MNATFSSHDHPLTATEWRPLAIVGVAIILVVAASFSALVFASRALTHARELHEPVLRTRDVIASVQRILSTLQDAETGERGFIISGREEFLEPYQSTRSSLDQQLQHLDSMLVDPQSRDLSAQLALQARQQMQYLERVINQRRDGDTHTVIEAMLQRTGKQQMDAIRGSIAALNNRADALLTQRQATSKRASESAQQIIALTLGAADAMIVIAGVLLLRYARKQLLAQKAVNHIAALLRSTVENLNQGVIVTDRHSRVLAWNQQFLMLRGLEESQMYVGMPTHQMQRAATSLRFMAHGEPKYDSRQIAFGFGDLSMPFDGEALCHDGRVLQVCGRPTPSGHYVATLSDITPLKLSEAAHRDQAIRLEAILNSIGDAIITLNESGSIESWNRGAQALFGYSSADILRRSVGLLALPATLLRDHQHWWGQLDPGQKYKPKQYQLVSKDGQLVDVDIVVSEVRIDSRRLLICLLRDIAERLEVERLKAGFVATVSHELRTPLTSILASLGLMAGAMAREMPPKALRLVDIARQNCERLIRLINDILDLEKAESGKLEFQLELHGLQALLQQAIDINRGFADNYAVRLELEINCVDASLLIDRDRLLQVLTNLISNAVKFSPSGSTIRVTAAIVGAVIKISIQDEGPGISSEFQQRIFQKFAQADASDSRSKGGTGLGLSISKTIMERLGGSIGFDARPSKGACFYITLPVSQAASPMSNRVTGHAAGHRVLVCDDDPDVRELIRAWLAESGAEAVPVQTIYEARAALASSRFDLALFDLHLADGSSVELLTQLRAEDSAPRIPVIVMTAASVSDAQLDQLHVLGVVDVLRKPMSRDELVGAVRRSTTTPAPNTVSPLYLGVGKCR